MNGKTMWEIGRALNSPSHEGLQELMEKRADFIQKWGSRCKTIFKVVPERFNDQVPDDIAAARQISPFGEKLIECFEKGWITHRTTRKEIDNLYKIVCGVVLAKRHRP